MLLIIIYSILLYCIYICVVLHVRMQAGTEKLLHTCANVCVVPLCLGQTLNQNLSEKQTANRELVAMATAAEPRNRVNEFLQPEQLQKFARNLSKDNLALVPLHRVSSTFQDVKKNGEALMLTAQNAVQRFRPDAQADEWTLLGRIGQSQSTRPSLRKSASEANLRRPRLSHAVTTKESPAAPQPEAFDWLGTFNEKINKARESNRPKFQLPSRVSFELQVRSLFMLEGGVAFLSGSFFARCNSFFPFTDTLLTYSCSSSFLAG